MAFIAVLDEHNCVQQIVTEGQAEGVGGILITDPQAAVARKAYLNASGHLVPRPRIDVPDPVAGVVQLPPLPAGTRVSVYDCADGAELYSAVAPEENWSENLVFSEPGRYAVDLIPPRPYLHTTAEVEIV